MIEGRTTQRIATSVPISIATVLTRHSATIVDISEGGAQIMGYTMARGSRFMIEHGDETVYAIVAWDEVDRMGVRFEHGLRPGALLNIARRTKAAACFGAVNDAATAHIPVRTQTRTFGRKTA